MQQLPLQCKHHFLLFGPNFEQCAQRVQYFTKSIVEPAYSTQNESHVKQT